MFLSGDFYDQLHSREGIAQLYLNLIDQYEWFIHVTGLENILSIKEQGLLVKAPGSITVPKLKTRAITTDTEILCFTPHNDYDPRRYGGKYQSKVAMAIHSSNLPKDIGLDFSFEAHWNELATICEQTVGAKPEEAAMQIIGGYTGVVASYVGVSAENLRLQMTCDADPETWPLLLSTDTSELSKIYIE